MSAMHPYDILIRPLLTERASEGATLPRRKYSFRVHPKANKIQIRRAVEAAFNVKVHAVNTVSVKGKPKRLRMQKLGRRPGWKKAIVTLAEGSEINLL